MPDDRPVSLFRNGRNQAVRIPREFELAGTHALMRKDGDSLVITPVRPRNLIELLAGWQPIEDDLPEAEDPPPQTRDLF